MATSSEDNRVLAMDGRVLVLTRADAFRPTRLDHAPLGRQEGAFTGFSDGPSMFAFFTKKTWPPGCADLEGCAHDAAGPGGKAVLARSQDGLGRFDTMATFSSASSCSRYRSSHPVQAFPEFRKISRVSRWCSCLALVGPRTPASARTYGTRVTRTSPSTSSRTCRTRRKSVFPSH